MVPAMRNTRIFKDAPPLMLYEDIVDELGRHPRENLISLRPAMELSNVATLAYIILQPDLAAGQVDNTKPSRKGKEKAQDPAEVATKVRARNDCLKEAWEKYWLVLPEEEKDKETPLRLWLEFATQVSVARRHDATKPSDLHSIPCHLYRPALFSQHHSAKATSDPRTRLVRRERCGSIRQMGSRERAGKRR
jgi:hypothetical protein